MKLYSLSTVKLTDRHIVYIYTYRDIDIMIIDSVPINYKTLIVAGGASIADIDNRSAATKMEPAL